MKVAEYEAQQSSNTTYSTKDLAGKELRVLGIVETRERPKGGKYATLDVDGNEIPSYYSIVSALCQDGNDPSTCREVTFYASGYLMKNLQRFFDAYPGETLEGRLEKGTPYEGADFVAWHLAPSDVQVGAGFSDDNLPF